MPNAKYLPVMMYHHVSPNGTFINSTPQHFESQLQWLQKNNWHSVTTQDVERFLQGHALPKKSVLITFDDGYLDNWVYAHPLLKKYGFNAVCFLVTSWIHNGLVRSQYNGNDDQYLPFCPDHQSCEKHIETGESDAVILRWSEIHAMQADGTFEFHSHTHTHTRWDLHPEQHKKNEYIQWELQQSKNTLLENLGSVSEHFCWPQGYYDPDYVSIAQSLGFKYLYTTDAFGFNTSSTLPHAIHRFAVRNRSGAVLGRRLNLATSTISGTIFNLRKKWRLNQRLKRRERIVR